MEGESVVTERIVCNVPQPRRHRRALLAHVAGLGCHFLDEVIETQQRSFAIDFAEREFVQELLDGVCAQVGQRVLEKEYLLVLEIT